MFRSVYGDGENFMECHGGSNYPLDYLVRTGVSDVTPFTATSGATYLSILESLRSQLECVINALNVSTDAIKDLDKRVTKIEETLPNMYDNLKDEILRIVATRTSVVEPVSGQLEPIADAMRRLYSATRMHSHTAGWFDLNTGTCQEEDNNGIAAVFRDLWSQPDAHVVSAGLIATDMDKVNR